MKDKKVSINVEDYKNILDLIEDDIGIDILWTEEDEEEWERKYNNKDAFYSYKE